MQIEEIEGAQIRRPEDLRLVIDQCRPTVIRGLCRDWPIVRVAQGGGNGAALDHLRRYASGGSVDYFVADAKLGGRYAYGEGPDGFNFTRQRSEMGAALDRIAANAHDGAQTCYIGSLPSDTYFPGFAQDHGCALLPPAVRPRLWIGNASDIACHYDSFDNLAIAVAGRRHFTLYPPDAIGDLYVGPIDHTMAGQPVSLAAIDPGAQERFPRFEAAAQRRLHVDLNPGDALYLPKLWWHGVKARDGINILTNYWWDASAAGPDAPYAAMLLAMIAIAERPEPERAAWRAFFDHYVFRPDGHPLAHLPAERHGILGPLKEGNYGRIRALVMRMLRGG